MVLVSLTELAEFERVWSEAEIGQVFLLDFTASWCGPCKRVAPVIEAMSEGAYSMVKMFKIDVDDAEPELVQLFEVEAMPTFVMFKKIDADSAPVRNRVTGASPDLVEAGLRILCA